MIGISDGLALGRADGDPRDDGRAVALLEGLDERDLGRVGLRDGQHQRLLLGVLVLLGELARARLGVGGRRLEDAHVGHQAAREEQVAGGVARRLDGERGEVVDVVAGLDRAEGAAGEVDVDADAALGLVQGEGRGLVGRRAEHLRDDLLVGVDVVGGDLALEACGALQGARRDVGPQDLLGAHHPGRLLAGRAGGDVLVGHHDLDALLIARHLVLVARRVEQHRGRGGYRERERDGDIAHAVGHCAVLVCVMFLPSR